MRRLIWLSAVTLLFSAWSSAQIASGNCGSLRIYVRYDDGRPAAMHLMVRIMSGASSTSIANGYTTDLGTVEFDHLPCGVLRAEVSGEGIRSTQSDQFELYPRSTTQTHEITVERIRGAEAAPPVGPTAKVNAATIEIPSEARKQFEKGTRAMAHQDWPAALQRMKKAIELYPKYAAAYNNLAVVYGKMNDLTSERTALEKAISLDDNFAEAYTNLGVLAIRQQDFSAAEGFLEHAAELDPQNPKNFLLLANVELMNKNYEAAIRNAAKVHALANDNLPLSHYIAARAYETENRMAEAQAELRMFLKEESKGPRADQVREELKQIESHKN